MSKHIVSLISCFLLLGLYGCGNGSSNENAEGNNANSDSTNELIVAQSEGAVTMDPHKQGTMPNMNILINMFDTLVAVDEDDNIIPSLATEWEQKNDKTWEFKLREDVEFHNGEPFNADAVKYSIDRVLDPETESPIVELDGIDNVEVIDDYTIEINTKKPDPVLPNKLSLFGGAIVPPEYLEDEGEEEFSQEPIGTGPFEFENWDKDNKVEMKKNEDYWGETSELEKLTFRKIPDDSSMKSALQSGEIDIASEVNPDTATQIEDDPGIKVESTLGIELNYLVQNTLNDSPLEDEKIRKALNYAVDVDLILESVQNGYGSKVSTMIPEQYEGYDSDIDSYPFDQDKAKSLIEEADYTGDLKIDMAAGNQNKQVAEIIAEQLREVGIEIDLDVQDENTLLDKIGTDDAPSLYMLNITGWTMDSSAFFNSDVRSDGKYSKWDNEDADKLIDTISTETNEEKRMQAFQELQQLFIDDNPFVYLYQTENLYAMNNEIQWEPNSVGLLKMNSASKE